MLVYSIRDNSVEEEKFFGQEIRGSQPQQTEEERQQKSEGGKSLESFYTCKEGGNTAANLGLFSSIHFLLLLNFLRLIIKIAFFSIFI